MVMRKGEVDFNIKLRKWDGFGVNYVEVAQTVNYDQDPQEYGGFSILSKKDREEILQMIFGEEGLKPGVVKMFIDPFQQQEDKQNDPALDQIEMSNYNHEKTTKWMRYFVRGGLKLTRDRGEGLSIITTLYCPPAWMTAQKVLRGRDLNPKYKYECARYMIAWAKYLKEVEQFPVKYICLHNEGESWQRWPEADDYGNIGTGHDYNMYWPPEQVVDFLKFMRGMLDNQGMEEVGLAPGETTNWYRFVERGYADAIADDDEAVKNLGLITSHGFFVGRYGRWYGPHTSAGNDIIRNKRPDIHSWVTSTSWSKMDPDFVYEIKSNIYSSKVNAIIPWACIQRPDKWVGGDPNPGTAFTVFEDCSYQVMPGYYYYKQVSRAGQPGMEVVRANSNDQEIGIIGFAAGKTANRDAVVVINIGEKDKELDLEINGIKNANYVAYRTSNEEKYREIGEYELSEGILKCKAPARSVTTFYALS